MGHCIIHGLEEETEDWENIYVWMDFHTGVCYKEKTKVKNKRREKDEDRRIKVKMDNLRDIFDKYDHITNMFCSRWHRGICGNIPSVPMAVRGSLEHKAGGRSGERRKGLCSVLCPR